MLKHLTLFVLSAVLAHADVTFSQLKFGTSSSDNERILGEADMRETFTNPEVDYSYRYRHAWAQGTIPVVPVVYYDRRSRAVAYQFLYSNRTNGGNDPKTGLPWEMPPTLGRSILAAFSSGNWTRLADEKGEKIWRSTDGKTFARITPTTLFLTQSEKLARLSLRSSRF